MKKMLSILGYLLSVGFNIPHLVATYKHLGTDAAMPEWYIYVIMGSFDLAVLILAILYKPDEDVKMDPGYVFAFILFILNIYLYWSPLPFPQSFVDIWQLIPGLCFSFVPAFLVFFCAGEISKQFKDFTKTDSEKLALVSIELKNVSFQLASVSSELGKYKKIVESFSKVKGAKITVNGVKSHVCKCDQLIVAGSNREGSQVCECGNLISW